MSNLVLGVIGGMGPFATAKFMENIILHTKATCDQEHLNMVVLNYCKMPDRTQVIQSGESEELLSHFKKALAILECSNVHTIAIPCNTSHYFYDEIQEMTSIPIINMVEETCKELAQDSLNHTIAVLGTDGTLKSGIYNKYAKKHGLNTLTLTPSQQTLIMDTIYNVKNHNIFSAPKFNNLVKEIISQNIPVILACTELSSLELPDELKKYTVDAMDILTKLSIRRCEKEWIEI